MFYKQTIDLQRNVLSNKVDKHFCHFNTRYTIMQLHRVLPDGTVLSGFAGWLDRIEELAYSYTRSTPFFPYFIYTRLAEMFVDKCERRVRNIDDNLEACHNKLPSG
jgi:hypothetical protein